jgi:hypothetical protein
MRALLLALALSLGGCFAFDEIDTNMKDWEHHHAPEPEAPEPAAGAPGARDPGSAWWQQARSVSSGESEADLVRCRLPEGESYMRRSDCESRGGSPR